MIIARPSHNNPFLTEESLYESPSIFGDDNYSRKWCFWFYLYAF